MPAKIVHINTAKGYRGGERQTELLIRGLAGCNVRQVLVARRGAPLGPRLRDVDVEVREVAGGLPSVTRATRGATLVHVHEGRSVYAAYLRSLFSGTPYVITRRVHSEAAAPAVNDADRNRRIVVANDVRDLRRDGGYARGAAIGSMGEPMVANQIVDSACDHVGRARQQRP